MLKKLILVREDRMGCKMRPDLGFDLPPGHLVFGGFLRPTAPRVHGVPRRALIAACRSAVSVFPDSETDFDFLVPDRLEQTNHEIFNRALHSCLDRGGSVFEVRQIELRFADILCVFSQALVECLPLLLDRFGIRIGGGGFSDVDRCLRS